MTFISWTIFGQYLDMTSNVLMSGLHRNRPLVDVILPLQCTGYLPRRVYIYLSNPSIKEKTEDRFLSPVSVAISWTKGLRMIRTITKVCSQSFPEQGAYSTYEIEGIIDLTA